MKTATVVRSRSLRFAITPMIDIVFLLIIFFLVATHFVKSETLAPVELPEATQAMNEDESLPHRLTITVSADGVYSVAGRQLKWTELEAMILTVDQQADTTREREVRIRSDASAAYRFVKPIFLACAQAQIRKVSISVLPAAQ